MLRVRVAGHHGHSHRTGEPAQVKEKSAMREHELSCVTSVNIKNFKNLDSSNNKLSLLIPKSLYIKNLCSTLNSDISSVPLYIA